MAANVNHLGYERRLAVVKQLLHSRGLQPSNISAIAYSEEYKYPFNNYLYKVELAPPASSLSFPGTQPGTTKAPSDGVSVLVIKLSNLAVDMNHTNRVENDVAAQHLVSQSIARAGLAPLIPAIYAWAPSTITDTVDEKDFGWIISELRSGVDLDLEFSSLELEDKEQVLEQIAAFLAAMQMVQLPEGITKFGGLTFDSSGHIVSGEAPLLKSEPAGSYAEWRVAKLRALLQQTIQSPVIQGWKSNGVDIRIEKFLTGGGLEKVLTSVDLQQKGLVHGDFTTNNMLFDKGTKKITAVLDFDWSCISNPFEEFLSLLSDIGCNVTLGDNKVTAAILSGDFSTPPDDEPTEKWEMAKAWYTAMSKSGVVPPCDMKGVEQIRDMLRLQTLLYPSKIVHSSKLAQMDDERKTELRGEAERELVGWLGRYGF